MPVHDFPRHGALEAAPVSHTPPARAGTASALPAPGFFCPWPAPHTQHPTPGRTTMPSPHPRPKKHSAVLRGALLLHALLLAPWGSAPAAEEPGKPPVQTVGEEVIGIPKPMESKGPCRRGVLLPHKDNFYIEYDGLLSEYQIEPFKRIRSVALDFEARRDISLGCDMLTTEDPRKVIMYGNRMIVIFDAMTGKLLDSKEFPKEVSIGPVEIDDDRIFIVANTSPHLNTTEGYQLWVWGLDSLEQEKAIDLNQLIAPLPQIENSPRMSVGRGRVYFIFGRLFFILNSKDLRLELRASAAPYVFSLPDLNELYFPSSTVIRDFVADREIDLKIPEGQAGLFDQQTRSFRYVERIGGTGTRQRSYDPTALSIKGYWPIALKSFKMKSNYAGDPSYSVSKFPLGTFQYHFHYYPQGEAIVFKESDKPNEPRQRIGLSLTPGARQYLNMETEEGLLVPINDATLKFYQSGFARGTP